jgi:hypothetical protein
MGSEEPGLTLQQVPLGARRGGGAVGLIIHSRGMVIIYVDIA